LVLAATIDAAVRIDSRGSNFYWLANNTNVKIDGLNWQLEIAILMKLTTRGQYSVKAMLDLSLQPGYGPASVSEIATRQQLPMPYLEKLLIELRRAGLVKSLRGAQGGYKLAKKPTQISLSDILVAVGESMVVDKPDLDKSGSPQRTDTNLAADWVTLMVWSRLNEKLQAALASISLADLYYDARSWQAAQGEVSNYII
jgi:Rrf2 family transcriptional regulator, iron-sulfur cluster assembly transcription factor